MVVAGPARSEVQEIALSDLQAASAASFAYQTASGGVVRHYPRSRLDERHIGRLIEAGPDAWPPLLVGRYPDGRLQLLDGHHRLEAAKALRLERVLCAVVPVADTIEALRLAVEANLQHGLMYRPAERARNVAVLYSFDYFHATQAGREKPSLLSYARRYGVPEPTLRRAVKQVQRGTGMAAPEGGDGEERFAAHYTQADVSRLISSTFRRLWEARRTFLDFFRGEKASEERIAREIARALLSADGDDVRTAVRRICLIARFLEAEGADIRRKA